MSGPPRTDGPPGPPPSRLATVATGLALAAAVAVAYSPVLGAGFVWDDTGHVTRPGLRGVAGLLRIWTSPGATQQYYPLLHTAFWLEFRLWGNAAAAYHALNVGLHLGVVLLLYRLLLRLGVAGAAFGAALFALHPVCVESVAWISEEKNTLSTLLCLGCALLYLRFDASRRWALYALAAATFAAALLTKSVTATLPAALLVLFWWKRGSLSVRRDVLPLLPWVGAGVASGAVTAWMERSYIGARGADFDLGPAGRLLVAGRAVWFYLGKLAWPANLSFIYPHWDIRPERVGGYLYPIAAVATLGLLFALRRRGRGPAAAGLLYVGLLFPALGFVSVYPFLYSYVADHFQYLADAALLPAAAAAGALAFRGWPSPARRAAALALLACLGVLTWRQCQPYRDARTLWTATIDRNPDCWMARNNLGVILADEGRVDEALAQYTRALELNPRFADTHNNLGVVLLAKDRTADAVREFRRAVELNADDVEAWNNLGKALLVTGRVDEAVAACRTALNLEPDDAVALRELGHAARLHRDMREAATDYGRASALDPGDADTLTNLGNALMATGRVSEGVDALRRAAALDPASAPTLANLGAALLAQGDTGEAIATLRRSVSLDARGADSHFNLGVALERTGDLDGACAEFRRTLECSPNDAQAHRALGGALFKQGKVDEALGEMARAR